MFSCVIVFYCVQCTKFDNIFSECNGRNFVHTYKPKEIKIQIKLLEIVLNYTISYLAGLVTSG